MHTFSMQDPVLLNRERVMSQPVCIPLNVIIKARTSTDGRRLVEVEASSEAKDSEGDVILQQALLASADSFISTGNLDLEHISEIGHRYNIPNPESYIIGRPVEVKDIGDGRTSVVGEISRSIDGVVDVVKNRYDSFWESLQRDPPVVWRASIYGFPIEGMTVDCRSGYCEKGATRFLIKGIDWRSMAFTKNPINDSLRNCAKIVSKANFEKAFAEYGRDMGFGSGMSASHSPALAAPMGLSGDAPPTAMAPAFPMNWPSSMEEAWGHHDLHMARGLCPHVGEMKSSVGFAQHFAGCCGMDQAMARVWGSALMHELLLHTRRQARAARG